MKECLYLETGTENTILRNISQSIKTIDKTIIEFISEMKKTMRREKGVGLAAPQVGKNIRVIVAEIGEGKVIGMINPIIIFMSEEKNQDDEEGCLSVPGSFGKVWRSNEIIVEYIDEKKQKQKRKFFYFDARILQHEIDHLDGILFVDRMTEEDKKIMHAKKQKNQSL